MISYTAKPPRPRLEFLSDSKGVYGLSIPVENSHVGPEQLIVRADRLRGNCSSWRRNSTALQPIPDHRAFRHSTEWYLSLRLADAMHAEAGFGSGRRPWIRADGVDEDEARRSFFGLKQAALRITNRLLCRVLSEAADQDALRLARRFTLKNREPVYIAAAKSRRAAQLIEAYPALGLLIFSRHFYPRNTQSRDLVKIQEDQHAFDQRRNYVADLVERGAALREVAAQFDVAMALRKIPPCAAHLALECGAVFDERPHLLHAYLPASQPGAKRWLRAVAKAREFGPPFVEWTARNAGHMGRTTAAVLAMVGDIADWVRASYVAGVPDHVLQVATGNEWRPSRREKCGANLITRRFDPSMNLHTVLDLSHEWHEAVAAHAPESSAPFPEPWCEGDTVAGYVIEPLATGRDLYVEGKAMHHCVSTYADRVAAGEAYFYSVKQDGERVATVELIRKDGKARLGEVRGPCNSIPKPSAFKATRKWLRTRDGFRLPKFHEAWLPPHQEAGPDLDDEIPF
jgi:hypothetical protein